MKAGQVLEDKLIQVQEQSLLKKTSRCVGRPDWQKAHDGAPMQKGHIQEEEEAVKEEFRNVVQACRAGVTKAQPVLTRAGGVRGHRKSFYHLH